MYVLGDDHTTYSTLKDPSVIFNPHTGAICRIGNWQDLIQEFDTLTRHYLMSGYPTVPFILISLPKDQATIDRVFNESGYILAIYESAQEESAKA